MNGFDRFCATLAITVGFATMLLGVLGLFLGFHFYITLPPIIGLVVFFLGWGMSITLLKLWPRSPRQSRLEKEVIEVESHPRYPEFLDADPEHLHIYKEHTKQRFYEWLDSQKGEPSDR